MIGCDVCNEWFHGKCIGITALEARKIKHYVCVKCAEKGHTTEYKQIITTPTPIPKKNLKNQF